MKLLILIFMTITSQVFGGGYMIKSDLEKCDSPRKVYPLKSTCQRQEGQSCYEQPDGYNCAYHRHSVSKSEAQSCTSDAHCQALLAALETKGCDDPKEKAVKVLTNPKEVYCTKEHIVAMSGLKAAYDAQEASEASDKASRQAVARSLKDKLELGTPLTGAEKDAALKYLLRGL